MKYFTYYPKFTYTFPDGSDLDVTDIYINQAIDIVDSSGYNIKGNEYLIEDGRSPDSIARQFYANPNLFWYILATNKILDFYKQWPVSYNGWLQQISKIHSQYTFFTPFKMDLKKGDIVAKYKTTGNYPFDKNNYGVVISFDPFMRSIDVDILSGDIKEQDEIIFLRSNNARSYDILFAPSGLTGQTLMKKELKMNSCTSFTIPDNNSKQSVFISPYSNYGMTGTISDGEEDITNTECILDMYIRNVLPTKIGVVNFRQESEKEWTFKKSVNVVPLNYVGQVLDAYVDNIANQ